MREFWKTYPAPPSDVSILLDRMPVGEGLWVAEGVYDFSGGERVLDGVLIFEPRGGKMWRDRWYFVKPSEVPEWRAGAKDFHNRRTVL